MDITLSLTKEQQAQLEAIATRKRWSVSTLIQAEVERMIEYNEWWCGEVQKGLDDIAAGRVFTHDEVVAKSRARFKDMRAQRSHESVNAS